MKLSWFPPMLLAGLCFSPCLAEQKTSQSKPNTTAAGTFVGRSGKPVAKARVILGEVVGDEEVTYAKIRISKTPAAMTDEQGRFQFSGFTPGNYTIVYQLPGASTILPVELNIKSFLAVTKSIAPLLRRVELGTNEPFAERLWGREYTLLRGHTFFTEGEFMKIWNATIRRGQQGPHMEIRRGLLWQSRIDDKSQLRFDAWSY